MGVKIGIDLGTTNTLVMFEQSGKLKNIKFKGDTNLPSVIYYGDDSVEIGRDAKKKGIIYPDKMIKSSKTYMGDATKVWNINNKKITPTMAATEILKEVKEKVTKKLKLEENAEIEAVITVPAYFTSNQKDETKKAAVNAGIKVLKIITEPVAAAIAYGLETGNKEKIFVFDLGGGTFDIAILEADPDKDAYNTINVDGDKKLGGDDFDAVLQKAFIEKIKNDVGIDFDNKSELSLEDQKKYASVRAKLLELAENTKINLSESESFLAEENFLFSYGDDNKNYDFKMEVTREFFYKKSELLIEKIKRKVKECLKDSGLKSSEIDKVVLVGGSSNLPFVSEILEKEFNKKPYSDQDVSNLVVQGAAIIATSYDGMRSNIEISDNISHSLGIEILDEYGKAAFAPLLIRGDKYPATAEKIFTTTTNYQKEVAINVYEGEDRDNLANNEFYGGFILDGIEEALKGKPQIKVRFSFDESGVLTVTAEDLKTNSKKEVIIEKGKKKEVEHKGENTDICLLIDVSGSMVGRRLDEAKLASKTLIEDILDFRVHKLGIISFGSYAKVISELTSNKEELKSSLMSLNAYGGTRMTEAIITGIEMLKNSKNKKVIILVTDGMPDSEKTANIAVNNAKKEKIDIYAIGVEDAKESFLKKLASPEDKYFVLENIKELQETFKKIINSLKYID